MQYEATQYRPGIILTLALNEPLSVGWGLLLLVIFVLGKLPYPHCFLRNKIQMPKLKLLHLVKTDLCILFATNAQIDAAHFCNVFPQQRIISAGTHGIRSRSLFA